MGGPCTQPIILDVMLAGLSLEKYNCSNAGWASKLLQDQAFEEGLSCDDLLP